MEILGGPLFGVAGAGESHGPGITTIVFGCPPGLRIAREEIQFFLNRRRPGGNKHGTPRHESDQVLLLSGLYDANHEELTQGPELHVSLKGGEVSDASRKPAPSSASYSAGYTTGEPIAALVLSTSKKSRDYAQFSGSSGAVRPGHTDLVKYHQSKGFVDIRGGGRSSYRSAISDVIGGSVARLFLQETFGTVFLSSICQVGPLKASLSLAEHCQKWILDGLQGVELDDAIASLQQQMESAEIHSIDTDFAQDAGELIKETRKAGDSLGAMLEVVALRVPALIGEPLYNSLKLRLMGSLGGLHAARSCEVGSGSQVISRKGSENNDSIRSSGYQTNHHGGMIGGITTGMPLVCRVGFKPTSTIVVPQKSIQKDLQEIDFLLEKGRHDPCVGVRAGVALESRMAIEVMNAVLMHQTRSIEPQSFQLF